MSGEARDQFAAYIPDGDLATYAAWEEGRAMTLEQEIAYALKQDESSSNG